MEFENKLNDFMNKVQIMLHDFDVQLKKENIHMDSGQLPKRIKEKLGIKL
jgi:hypothetical protein